MTLPGRVVAYIVVILGLVAALHGIARHGARHGWTSTAFAAVAGLAGCAAAPVAVAPPVAASCVYISEITQTLRREFGELPVMLGLEASAVMLLFVSAGGASWSVVEVNEDGCAQVTLSGVGLRGLNGHGGQGA
jgi:hypothetical protein